MWLTQGTVKQQPKQNMPSSSARNNNLSIFSLQGLRSPSTGNPRRHQDFLPLLLPAHPSMDGMSECSGLPHYPKEVQRSFQRYTGKQFARETSCPQKAHLTLLICHHEEYEETKDLWQHMFLDTERQKRQTLHQVTKRSLFPSCG